MYVTARDPSYESKMDEWVVKALQPRLALCRAVGRIDISGTGKSHYSLRANLEDSSMDLAEKLNAFSAWESKITHGDRSYIFRHNAVHIGELNPLLRLDSGTIGADWRMIQKSEYPYGRFYLNGNRAVQVRLFLRPGSSQFDLQEQIITLKSRLGDNIPYHLLTYRDQVEDLNDKLRSIGISMVITLMALVLTMRLFTRSVRPGLLIGMVLMLTLAVSVIAISYLKVQLDVITLLGILIGTGLMVDNPIVINSELRRAGNLAGLIRNAGPPLLIANLTTILVFLPFLLMNRLSFEIFSGFLIALVLLLFFSFVLGLIVPFLWRSNFTPDYTGKDKFLIRRPKTIILVSILVLLCSLTFAWRIDKTWLPSYGSRYWQVDTRKSLPVNNARAVVDHHIEGEWSREIKLPGKVLTLEQMPDAKKSGDPYNKLFDNHDYAWYRPHDKVKLKVWMERVRILMPWFSASGYVDGEIPHGKDKMFVLESADVKIENDLSINEFSRRHEVKGAVHPDLAERRYDNFGELVRVSLTERQADSLKGAGFRIENSNGEGIISNRVAAWRSVVFVVLSVFAGLYIYFRSVWISLWLLCVIPISIIGSTVLLHFSALSFNMISIAAILFSSGVGINDAVIKADTIMRALRRGFDFDLALNLACRRRFVPILLTSITTLVSCLIQLSITPEWDQIQLSILIALAGGILFSTLWAIFTMPAILKVIGKDYLIVQPIA